MRSSEGVAVRLLVVFLLAFFLVSPAAAQGVRLHVLAATGTAEEVQAALQTGANFNDASALLEAGADPKARGTAGRTLMQYAENNPAMVKDAALHLSGQRPMPLFQHRREE